MSDCQSHLGAQGVSHWVGVGDGPHDRDGLDQALLENLQVRLQF